MNFSLNPRRKDLQNFREQTSRCLEFWIKQVSRVLFPHRLPLEKKIESFLSTKRNKLFQFSCLSGDTRIWTGEKGFAVPRLTTRPCRQNDTNIWEYPVPQKTKQKREGVLNFFFWCVCILNSVFFNPPFQRDLLPFSIVLLKKKNKRIAFSHKSKNFGTNQIATFNYKFLNNSWIWISNGFFLMRKKIEIDTFSISIITATVNICQPRNINSSCYTDII